MIYSWFGVFSRKGELLAVEEGELMARSAKENLERYPPPYNTENSVRPVTVVEGDLGDLTMAILEDAKLKLPGWPRAKYVQHQDISGKKDKKDEL